MLVKALWDYLRSAVLFFLLIGFVITCSFLVFFSSVSLSEEDIRTFAPVVFFNSLVLTILFVAADALRRKIAVERPLKEIQKCLKRLMQGDFDARVSISVLENLGTGFKDIARSINLLAEELGGVETLRTDFIANVSHEMKTPLAVMQNYGTLLQAPGLPEEKRLEYARAVTDGSRRMADLMTNILKLNRLENQQIYPQAQVYDLGEQLCQCLLQYESVWEREEIEIDTDIAENVAIKADAELLSLVWNNLFSNAFKFTEKGGRVSVSLAADESHVTVAVSDTGCGMTPEVGAHIFEKFYQGDTSHATAGNGLGLALVKRIMDIMGGEISVSSTVGVGSAFTVKLRRSADGAL